MGRRFCLRLLAAILEGLLAVAIQHECDHLEGVLMIDHMGPLKKRLTHRKMVKRAEAEAST